MDNGIHFTDMGQELVAKAFALAGALHQTGDIHEFEGSWHDAVRIDNLRQLLETLIGNLHHAHIGIDRAKRVVGGFRPGLGNCIEQRRFAYIGQSDNTCF
ncbi:hypothetical protein D3C75_965160 [compost metagenome]